MENSIAVMTDRITTILSGNEPSLMLFGSVVLDDFKLGWSDIDILCLTNKTITDSQMDELVILRQTLLPEYPDNPYFKLFEGGMLTAAAFVNNRDDNVVYWGTSGQRRVNRFELDPFGKIELIENGRLLYGNDFRHLIKYPSKEEILLAVQRHYAAIRKYGTSHAGWLLDTARCLYTLRTGKVIAKTKAGEWAIEEKLCPDAAVMAKVVQIRKNPLELLNNTKEWQETLGPHIQKFADVLEAELRGV